MAEKVYSFLASVDGFKQIHRNAHKKAKKSCEV